MEQNKPDGEKSREVEKGTTKRTWQTVAALLVVLGLVLISGLFWSLWGVLAAYIDPSPTDATEKKDLVYIFVIIAGGMIGILTAIVAVGNLTISRRNLKNAEDTLQLQRDLEYQRAQETALKEYVESVTKLVSEGLRDEDSLSPLRLLVRGRTLSLFRQLDSRRKGALLQVLREADLLHKGTPVIGLSGADLSGAYLQYLDLRDAELSGTILENADLRDANLSNINLGGAYLSGADLYKANLRGASLENADLQRKDELDLSGADLSGADLNEADLTGADLRGVKGINKEKLKAQAKSLDGAAMPDDISAPSRQGPAEDGENRGPS